MYAVRTQFDLLCLGGEIAQNGCQVAEYNPVKLPNLDVIWGIRGHWCENFFRIKE